MWSDTLLAAERAHLALLLTWGAASVLVGTMVIALLAARRARAPLLSHFAIQTAVWGAVEVALAGVAWRGVAPRDVSAATRLDRLVWLSAGLDVAYIATGATLAITGAALGRRPRVIGAGLGVILQGLGLIVLDLRFLVVLGRLV